MLANETDAAVARAMAHWPQAGVERDAVARSWQREFRATDATVFEAALDAVIAAGGDKFPSATSLRKQVQRLTAQFVADAPSTAVCDGSGYVSGDGGVVPCSACNPLAYEAFVAGRPYREPPAGTVLPRPCVPDPPAIVAINDPRALAALEEGIAQGRRERSLMGDGLRRARARWYEEQRQGADKPATSFPMPDVEDDPSVTQVQPAIVELLRRLGVGGRKEGPR